MFIQIIYKEINNFSKPKAFENTLQSQLAWCIPPLGKGLKNTYKIEKFP